MTCQHQHIEPAECGACQLEAAARPLILDEIIDLADQAAIDLRDETPAVA